MKDRGYWLPPGYGKLIAYDGYYIEAEAVYTTPDIYTDWERFLTSLYTGLHAKVPFLQQVCDWEPSPSGADRFVLAKDVWVSIILEDVDSYVAVYAIVPEGCKTPGKAKRHLSVIVRRLQSLLTASYPGHVWQRRNSQRLKYIG